MQGLLSLALAWVLGSIVKRIILGLGVAVIVYTGVSSLIDAVNGFITTQMGSFPASVAQLMNVLNVTTAVNMLLSAFTFHYTLMFTGKKIVFNPPTT